MECRCAAYGHTGMPIAKPFAIDLSQTFEHLPRAPIVEAVIHLQTRAGSDWEEARVTPHIKESLLDYPSVESVHSFSFNSEFRLDKPAQARQISSSSSTQAYGWVGLRATSLDSKYVAQFTRDGFALSRLRPYESWSEFHKEAIRLWTIHVGLAEPTEIDRLGVRFINRLELPMGNGGVELDDYFVRLAHPVDEMPTRGFFYRDVLGVPGHPYLVNVIRTVLTSETSDPLRASVLLDIDALCPAPFGADMDSIERRLADLHWLKNSVFFRLMKDKGLELCR